MALHQIPRNVKGQGRILMIFSVKGLIYTAIGGIIGAIFYMMFKSIGLDYVGLGFLAFFALAGFVIGTFKFPKIETIGFTHKVGGENIDDVIKRAIKFKLNRNKIYVYDIKEDTKDE